MLVATLPLIFALLAQAASVVAELELNSFVKSATNPGESSPAIGASAGDGDLAAPLVVQPTNPATTSRHPGIKEMARDLVEDVKHLPSKENLFWAGLGGGLALAVHPADDNVKESLVNSDFAHNFFRLGQYLGELYTLLPAAATVYTIGRAKDLPKVSHVGADLLESLAISEALVQALKYATQRERPDGSDKHSFPSGHAADTFALATALERHVSWGWAVPAYIFASYVAISRLPDNKHWLSDTVFGASVGIIAGRTVTRHGRPFPLAVAAVPGGAEILYTRRSDQSP
jgi:hypothetical protein